MSKMRMLRWMYGNTNKDRVRNEVIHKKIEVASIEDMLSGLYGTECWTVKN